MNGLIPEAFGQERQGLQREVQASGNVHHCHYISYSRASKSNTMYNPFQDIQTERHEYEACIAYTEAIPMDPRNGRETYVLKVGEWQITGQKNTDEGGGNSELFKSISITQQSNDPDYGPPVGSKSDNPEMIVIEDPWNGDVHSRGYTFEVGGRLQKGTFKADASVGYDNASFGKKPDTTIGSNRTLLYGTFSFPVDVIQEPVPQSEGSKGQFAILLWVECLLAETVRYQFRSPLTQTRAR